MKKSCLIIVFLLSIVVTIFAQDSDYQTLRTFMSAQMYGEAYNELMQRELAGLILDSKLKSLKIDLLDRTNLKLQKQAKASPDDPTVFTILADIAFQKGDYDRASMYISNALSNNPKPISNYVFAKILFRKGNISQAFDQMSKVLEAIPDSLIVFNDFQFLYNCKQYGVSTAKKITKDCTFLIRSTPIAYENNDVEIPESPFENDPTQSANAPDFSDYNTASKDNSEDFGDDYSDNGENVDEDLSELSKIDITLESEKNKYEEKEEEEELAKVQTSNKEEEIKDSEFDFDGSEDKVDEKNEKEEKVEKEEEQNNELDDKEDDEADPELIKLEADKLFASAKTKFELGNYDTALLNLKELSKINPNYPGKEELENKIKVEIKIEKNYKEAKEIIKNNEFKDYDKAIEYLKTAYNKSTTKFPDSPLFLGDAYSSKDNADFDQAIYYYNIVIENTDFNAETRRDVKWRKFEICMQQEKYDEAYEIYSDFSVNERDFFNSHNDMKNRYIFLWHFYSIYILAFFTILVVLVIIVFLLQFVPDLALIGGKPIDNAQRALNASNYNKAIKIAEKALLKKQPIQLDRQLREILVQAYFTIEKYKECQNHAKKILENFPDNTVAWAYIAKASVEIKDTSKEAIKMYEDMYKNDPSRKELLPMLAQYYASNKDTSPNAMAVLQDYHNIAPEDTNVIIALADGYVKNRTMDKEIVPILSDAIKLKDKLDYRELLARTFSKCEMYEEAARECVNVLNKNINNIGIHVVYTSSMKKIKQVAKAIAQYKEFIRANPNNNQLVEILDGLKKEDIDTSTPVDDIPSVFDSLGMPGMNEEEDRVPPEQSSTPIPDFMAGDNNQQSINDETNNSKTSDLPEGIQTLNPFGDDDSLFDGFDTDELPEELGGTSRAPVETSKSLDSLIDNFNSSNTSINDISFDNNSIGNIPSAVRKDSSNSSQTGSSLKIVQKVEEARNLALSKKWNQVIDILSPEFASVRNSEAGLLLIEAWLGSNKPEMALEIINTLDFDPEILPENIKDAMYRTAVALETNKNYKEALKLYDTICNSDINYKDAFDKSDRLYEKMKG